MRRDIGDGMVAEAAGNLGGERGVADKGRAHRDAPRAEGEQPLERSERADPSPGIDPDSRHGANTPDGRRIGSLSRSVLLERCREVDHMHPPRTAIAEILGNGHGIIGIDLHMGAIAALEAHDLPADEVDCGKDDHGRPPGTRETKFLRMRRPTVEDFSGWNCTAKSADPSQIALANRLV